MIMVTSFAVMDGPHDAVGAATATRPLNIGHAAVVATAGWFSCKAGILMLVMCNSGGPRWGVSWDGSPTVVRWAAFG